MIMDSHRERSVAIQPLSTQTLALIDTAFRAQKSRNLLLETPQGKVMVKGQRSARDPVRFWLLSVVGKFLRGPLIKPVPAYGGAKAQEIEIRRLGELRVAGIPVPQVLHIAKDYFVMQAIEGRPLDSLVSGADSQAHTVFEQGLEAIARVHAAGQYLSQGFARNILVNSQGLFFIDFEDDPLQVMTLEQAQARDYLVYLLSVVWLNRAMHDQWKTSWQRFKQGMNPRVRDLILNTARGFMWMRHLPNTRRPFGRDILQAQALAEFFCASQLSQCL
jgi:tRNA A-37 threonylcarbamoyl transferase component Bud32